MKKLLLLPLLFSLCSCEPKIQLNSAYHTPNVLDYSHDYAKYQEKNPEGWYIITEIDKYETTEDQYDLRGVMKSRPKRFNLYRVSFLAPGSRSGSPQYREYPASEFRKLGVKIGDIITYDQEITSRMNPIILEKPIRVEYKPVEKTIDRYTFENKEQDAGFIKAAKAFKNPQIDFQTYRKKGYEGPIYLIQHISNGSKGKVWATYRNEYGIVYKKTFVSAAVTTENLKIFSIVELQWDGEVPMLKKLPFYLKEQ